jgi:hypothetical protein
MPSHLNAHAGSRQLCEDLFASLQSKIPDLQLARAKDTCGFYQLNHNRFAYVYHRTDSFHIRVYFRGIDSAPPVDTTGTLDIQVRPKVEKGWDKELPYFVNIEQRSQVESAANVLFSFAFPLAKRKGKGKYSTAPTPIATDKSEALPGRVETTNYRILRDTELARKIKAMHEYKCQICGHTIILLDGSFYAEAHHIKPLGEPHNGPDIAGNILCLCPNHHAEMDYLASSIVLTNIRVHPEHLIDQQYVTYHNELRTSKHPREMERGQASKLTK